MAWFMLSIHCCGLTCSWNSLAMLSSRVSAWVGLSAWSQDWAKTLALDAIEDMSLRNCASSPVNRLALSVRTGTPPDWTQPAFSVSSTRVVEKNFFATSWSAADDLEEIERYWPGLPTVSVGSPLPPSIPGKFIQPSPPDLTKSPPLATWMPYDQLPCTIIAALPV